MNFDALGLVVLVNVAVFGLMSLVLVFQPFKKMGQWLERRRQVFIWTQTILLLFAVGFIYFYYLQSILIILLIVSFGLYSLPNTLSLFSLSLWNSKTSKLGHLLWQFLLGFSSVYNIIEVARMESIHSNGVADFEVNPLFKSMALLAIVAFYIIQTFYLVYIAQKK